MSPPKISTLAPPLPPPEPPLSPTLRDPPQHLQDGGAGLAPGDLPFSLGPLLYLLSGLVPLGLSAAVFLLDLRKSPYWPAALSGPLGSPLMSSGSPTSGLDARASPRSPKATPASGFEIFGLQLRRSTLAEVRAAVLARGATILSEGGSPYVLVTTGDAAYQMSGLKWVRYVFFDKNSTLGDVNFTRATGANGRAAYARRKAELAARFTLDKELETMVMLHGPEVRVSLWIQDDFLTERYEGYSQR